MVWSERRAISVKNVILPRDDAPSDTVALTQGKLEHPFGEILEGLPHSPDLAPCYFHVVCPLKEALGICPHTRPILGGRNIEVGNFDIPSLGKFCFKSRKIWRNMISICCVVTK